MKIRYLGQQDFQTTWQAMHDFTHNRDAQSEDELWLLEHFPVFTQGQAGKAEHILDTHEIQVVQTDRGGQVTYHGPGQIIAYVLLDLKRAQIGVRSLVFLLEEAVIQLLAEDGVVAQRVLARPGVYVCGSKIASLGLRVKRGCSYHGMSFNVDMDLTPFAAINPCGYSALKMTQCRDFLPKINVLEMQQRLAAHISKAVAWLQASRQ